MTNLQSYINQATLLATTGVHRRYRVGAILVKSGQPIAQGANSYKTHPIMQGKTLHAEIQALIGVQYRDLVGSIMYVVRLNKTGKVGMARPCEVCREILSRYGIRKVFFTNQLGLVSRIDL